MDGILQDQVFKLEIKGDVWHVYLVDENDTTIVEEGDIAVTKFSDREIYFKGMSELDISHEVFHVYFGYSYVETANLSQGQTEEVACEIYSHEKHNMLKTEAKILKGLQALKKE